MIVQLIALGFLALGAVALFVNIFRSRGRTPEARSSSVYPALTDEVGRVAEEGDSILVALGDGSLIGTHAMVSIAALQGLSAMLDLSAAYDTPPILTTADPTLYLLAGDWMRRAYARLGNVSLYRPGFVRFTAGTPATYAAMASTIIFDEAIGSSVLLGSFNQEASLLLEAARRQGVRSSGGTISLPGMAAMYPALDAESFVMGETFFSGASDVLHRPLYWASLLTQDLLRWVVIAGIVAAALLSILSPGA